MEELQELYNELIHKNTKKVDVLAPLAATRFIAEEDKNYMIIRDGEVIPSEFNDYIFKNIEDRKIALTPHALQQICSKVGIPMSYIAKCDPELRQHNLNHWMEKSMENNLIRCVLDNGSSRVRGILSDKYTPVDDSFVVKNLYQAIESSNLKDPLITRMYAGDDMLRVQITDSKLPVVGDTTMAVYCGNSEIGIQRIYLELSLYTFACTNGIRITNFTTEFNRRHIGNIQYNMLQNNFHNQIECIVSNYTYMVQYMEIANQLQVTKNSFCKYIEDSKNFSIAFKDSMKTRIKNLITKSVLWNYISEMTNEAQNYKETERMEIERQAGLYMDFVIQSKKGKHDLK